MSHLTKNGLTTTIPVTGRIPNLPSVTAWVEEIASLTRPSAIHFLDGSDEEYERLVEGLIESGTIVRLNPGKQPGSIYARTDPDDVARVEDSTFICSVDENDSGPTNNWMDPKQMKTIMTKLYNGCMVGRTMYVIPFCMGHVDSPDPKFGIEITDSAYVAISMKIMTRMGTKVMEAMEKLEADFVPALHSCRPASRTSPGHATTSNTSSTSPRSGPSGATAPDMAATPCWARSATRCGSHL